MTWYAEKKSSGSWRENSTAEEKITQPINALEKSGTVKANLINPNL